MDTYITKNLPQIVRLSQASPKVSVEVAIKQFTATVYTMICYVKIYPGSLQIHH